MQEDFGLIEDEGEDEPLVAADTPDWLADLGVDDEDEEEESEAPLQTEQPGWLSEELQEDFGLIEDEGEDEPLVAADTPDWLAELDADEDEELQEDFGLIEDKGEDEPLVAADTPDWLAELDTDEDEELQEDFDLIEDEGEDEPLVAAGTPDWLAELDTDEDEELQEDFDLIEDEGEDEPLVAAGTPDWLSEEFQEDFDLDVDEETPDWITDVENVVEEAQEETLVANPLDLLNEAPEETAPEPASNAPDWLNAMVPGLDVDYEAEEDKPIETEYVEEGAGEAEIDWLNQIVEEEINQPPETPLEALPGLSAEPEPEAEATASRFAFSKPPAWLSFSRPPAWAAKAQEPKTEEPERKSGGGLFGWLRRPKKQAPPEDDLIDDEDIAALEDELDQLGLLDEEEPPQRNPGIKPLSLGRKPADDEDK